MKGRFTLLGSSDRQGNDVRLSTTVITAAQIVRLRSRSEHQLASLSRPFSTQIGRVMAQLVARDWIPVVFHGKRSQSEQARKVALGYSKTMASFHVDDTRLSKGRNGLYWSTVGEAADVVDARHLWAGPAADLDFEFWSDLGRFAKQEGLRWGGDWKGFRDVAHVEAVRIEIAQDTRGRLV